MKCCEKNHNDSKSEGKKHNPMKHMLMMALCCGLPYLILGVLPFINLGNGFKAGLVAISPFICPIMMVLMMVTMFKSNKKGSCSDNKKEI